MSQKVRSHRDKSVLTFSTYFFNFPSIIYLSRRKLLTASIFFSISLNTHIVSMLQKHLLLEAYFSVFLKDNKTNSIRILHIATQQT